MDGRRSVSIRVEGCSIVMKRYASQRLRLRLRVHSKVRAMRSCGVECSDSGGGCTALHREDSARILH